MAVYDQIGGAVPFEQRGECPVLRRLSEMLVVIMMTSNERMSVDFGLVDGEEWECECKGD